MMKCKETVSLRKKTGALIYDWPRFLRVFLKPGNWKFFCNRNDEITVDYGRTGVRCGGIYTRSLHLCDVFPVTARWLLSRALKDHPVRLKEEPDHAKEWGCRNGKEPQEESLDVSFLIGHRGLERLPLLLTTLKSIAAQTEVSFECIVVEQDREKIVSDTLPGWVRYIYTPLSERDSSYNRSRAFNEAAKAARGRVLVLHDNDILVPADYASEVSRRISFGSEVVQLKRFVFYLNQASSKKICETGFLRGAAACDHVTENLCAGGSLAVLKQTYRELGGMDEEFVGWGGEDNEFWDRCLIRKVWNHAYLPFIHLWHASLADRRQGNPMMSLLKQKLTIRPEQRIQQLLSRQEAE